MEIDTLEIALLEIATLDITTLEITYLEIAKHYHQTMSFMNCKLLICKRSGRDWNGGQTHSFFFKYRH